MSNSKVIAVTGASRGIGASIVEALLNCGFQVACLSRKGIGVENQALSQEQANRCFNLPCDVTNETAIKSAFAQIVEQTGHLDGLVNNAGQFMLTKGAECPTADFEKLMSTNATSVFVASREVFPYLKEQGGTIVNIGSYYDKIGVKYNAGYCASKAAIGAISRCLAVEWARFGIRVMNVAPGFIVTDLNKDALTNDTFRESLLQRIPGGKTGTPQEVGKLVASIFSNDLNFLTGETIYIDGGEGMAL